jgi:hypothetical protein
VNGPILYRKVFRAIHHVEKDQLPMYRTLSLAASKVGVLLMMLLWAAVRSARGKLGLG